MKFGKTSDFIKIYEQNFEPQSVHLNRVNTNALILLSDVSAHEIHGKINLGEVRT